MGFAPLPVLLLSALIHMAKAECQQVGVRFHRGYALRGPYGTCQRGDTNMHQVIKCMGVLTSLALGHEDGLSWDGFIGDSRARLDTSRPGFEWGWRQYSICFFLQVVWYNFCPLFLLSKCPFNNSGGHVLGDPLPRRLGQIFTRHLRDDVA